LRITVSNTDQVNLAAAQGYEGAKNGRDGSAKRMTSEQIAKAQRLARE